MSTASSAAALGLVTLGDVVPIPGTAGHPGSYRFAVIARPLCHEALQRLALRADPELYPSVLEAAELVVTEGASGVITTCGYFTPYQTALSRDLPVPVLSSSLLQLPMIRALVGDRTILVLASNRAAADARCIRAAGLDPRDRVIVRGLDGPGPFAAQVFEAGEITDIEAIVGQASAAVEEALAGHPDIGAICVECGELTLVSRALRRRTGLPVFDYFTAADLLQQAVDTSPAP
ncbi:aspartate/glutamate racemase family protein [Gulosibacter sp. 10]|uniref:aspartate/glutamate racemase family protein n=1 Tax=Gulosibacter sp. 10 TaxID=1255570 RepID=UPI00097F558F|nr:aspartate/glutamate racemase family protein [Gulosibacter sp. 10]SJM57434.1 hypothetical protein FM112_05280 [Gulosibacter sp. 10]